MDNLTGTASILWRGKYLIVAGLVLGIVGATVATKTASKVYEATGLIQVASDTPSGGAEVLGLQQASQDLASTYATLITSRSFLARISGQVAGGRYSVGDLAQNVNASAVTQNTQNTNLIEITAQGPRRERRSSLRGRSPRRSSGRSGRTPRIVRSSSRRSSRSESRCSLRRSMR